ncbi:MAG: hypothetical protein JO051_15375 [Acidobacteriaceae bacterium]|nr:hypothetical protein [Acidobacteriaceae bacterium]
MLPPESQVLLSVGIPTIAVLVGILINNRQIDVCNRNIEVLRQDMRHEFSSLRIEMNARFEAEHQALLRVEGVVDARLKHLEDRS